MTRHELHPRDDRRGRIRERVCRRVSFDLSGLRVLQTRENDYLCQGFVE